MLLCLFLSYLVASAWESLAHWQILHAGKHARQRWRDWGGFGDLLRLAFFYHNRVHHRRTFVSNYWVQFDSPLQRQRLDQRLKGEIRKRLMSNGYGTTITGFWELFTFAAFPMLLNSVLCALLAPRWVLLGIMIGLLPLLMTKYIHPLLHVDVNELSAGANGPRQSLIQSGSFRFLQQYHFLHHKYGLVNFNLLPGADLLLFVYRYDRRHFISFDGRYHPG